MRRSAYFSNRGSVSQPRRPATRAISRNAPSRGGAAWPERAERSRDALGVDLGRVAIVGAAPLQDAGVLVLWHDVDPLSQLLPRRDRRGRLEVEHDRAFAGVELAEHRTRA